MDIRLHFVERGEGEPLILLHGNGESCAYFRHQLAFFSANRRCIAVDTRGHGLSPRGSAPFTLTQFAEDLREFMDEHQIGAADVLGFSDGGNIALLFALRYPERVRRLVLNGANLEPSGVRARYQRVIEREYADAVEKAEESPGAQFDAELLGLMVNEPHIPPEALAALTCPVLVIAGTRDMIRRDHTRLIAASIPGARLVLLPGTHFIAAETPEGFNEAVTEFLAENR